MDISTEQYKAFITLSNLTLHELEPLTWHVSQSNRAEGQVPHGIEDPRSVVYEWAKTLECDVTETEYDDYTSVRFSTNYGDYGTFITIWGHADRV